VVGSSASSIGPILIISNALFESGSLVRHGGVVGEEIKAKDRRKDVKNKIN